MPAKKWAIRILIGVGAVLIAIVMLNMITVAAWMGRIPSIEKQGAMKKWEEQEGLNSPNYKIADALVERAEEPGSLTDANMDTLKRLSDDHYRGVRICVLRVLMRTGKTPQVTKASSIARNMLNDPDGAVRQGAIETLHILKAPDIQNVARRMLNDSSAQVREAAQKMLPQKSLSIIDNSHPH